MFQTPVDGQTWDFGPWTLDYRIRLLVPNTGEIPLIADF